MRCKSTKDGTNQWAVETTGGSVLLRMRRNRHAMNDFGNANSPQQMWTSATNDGNLMHAHKSTATFLPFPITPSPLPQFSFLSASLSLSLSLARSTCRALQTNGACLFSCMDMTTSKTACDDGWMEKDREKERLPGMRNNATSHP